MTMPDSAEVCALVRALAQRELVPRFQNVGHRIKSDGSLVTEADHAMQAALQDALQQRWPQFGMLGEVMPVAEQQALIDAPGEGLWLVDPLDGTRNFAAGLPFFSVSVALLQQDHIALGLVYDPMRDECFNAVRGGEAQLNGAPLECMDMPDSLSECNALIDFKRLAPATAAMLASDPPYSSQRSFGSVALDWCWLAAGRLHLYVHGSQNIWDYAGGHAVFQAAGGYSATLQGNPVFSPRLEKRSAVASLKKELFEPWLASLQSTL